MDKFGVRGVFECCKGIKGSQAGGSKKKIRKNNPFCQDRVVKIFWKGSSVSWVATFKGDEKFRMQAVKWVVAKLQGDFLQGNEWSRSYREINRHPSLPWNFITHGFLDPSAVPDCVVLRALLETPSENPSQNPFLL